MVLKNVEYEVSSSEYSRIIHVPAEVCQKCGEQILTEKAQEQIIRAEEELQQ